MRQVLIPLAVAVLLAGSSRTADAVHLTRDQAITVNAPGFWLVLFHEYTFDTTTHSGVQFGRTTIPTPWLLYDSWFGAFLYDYTSGQYEEEYYYFNSRL